MPNFMNIHPVGDDLFHAGRADRLEEVNSRSRNFVTAPRNGKTLKERCTAVSTRRFCLVQYMVRLDGCLHVLLSNAENKSHFAIHYKLMSP